MTTSGRDLSGRCGSCIFFMRKQVDASGQGVGECRLGCWPAPLKDMATCASHQAPGQAPRPAARKERSAKTATPKQLDPARSPIPAEIGIDMDQDQFRSVLREILLDELGLRDIELGERWQGGEVVLVPGKPGVQEKRIPIDNLFRKVVLIREKLRVLEQKLNNHDKLSDEDRVQLQQYITQCYGSLTTFNVLFKTKEDGFIGQSGKDD